MAGGFAGEPVRADGSIGIAVEPWGELGSAEIEARIAGEGSAPVGEV